MRILVTNDDGIHSPGLHVLARAIVAAGFDTIVVAPEHDMSGSGASLGHLASGNSIEYRPCAVPGLPDTPAYAVHGTPAVCAMVARLGGFGEAPEIIASGINPGCNTGQATLHSGTVGAALTGANFGARGLAVSIDWHDTTRHWETAAAYAVAGLHWLVGQNRRYVVNVNVPNTPLDEVKGVRWARLARFGNVRSALSSSEDGRFQLEFKDSNEPLPDDVDVAVVASGHVSVTVLTGLASSDSLDVADFIHSAVHASA